MFFSKSCMFPVLFDALVLTLINFPPILQTHLGLFKLHASGV